MKLLQLRQIIKEEIYKAINEKDEKDEKDEMDQSVKKHFNKGHFVVINPKDIKVDDSIVAKSAMDFYTVKGINSDKGTVTISDDAFGDKRTLSMKKVVQNFLKVK